MVTDVDEVVVVGVDTLVLDELEDVLLDTLVVTIDDEVVVVGVDSLVLDELEDVLLDTLVLDEVEVELLELTLECVE